jgi:hypothetical protein
VTQRHFEARHHAGEAFLRRQRPALEGAGINGSTTIDVLSISPKVQTRVMTLM